MAGDWIKMRSGLATNPKVIRMARFLAGNKHFQEWWTRGTNKSCDVTVYELCDVTVVTRVTVGSLLCVWSAANECASKDGFIRGITLFEVDEMAGVPGFGEAMAMIGWCIESDEGIQFPNFEEHNIVGKERSSSAKTGAQRTKEWREKKRSGVHSNGDASDVTVTSQSDHREEKRREEKSISTSLRSVEGAKPRATRQCPDSFDVTDELKDWAATECPGIDLMRETAKFRDHTFKTGHSDWPATWRNWMRNASDFAKPPAKTAAFVRAPSEAEIRVYRSSPHIMDPHARARVEAHLGVKPTPETIDMEAGNAHAIALDR